MKTKLRTYHYKTDKGEYVSEMFRVDKGIYEFETSLENKVVSKGNKIELKTALDLEKYIRNRIKALEAGESIKIVETEEIEEVNETTDIDEMQDAIVEVLAKDDEIDDNEKAMEQFEKETGKSAITSRNTVRKDFIKWKEQNY